MTVHAKLPSTKFVMILLIITTMFFSCKKANQEEPTKPKGPAMREIEDTELNDLISEIDAFYEYTQELIGDEYATTVSFPTDITPGTAVTLLENCFNYNFCQLDYSLLQTHTINIVVEYSMDGNGDVTSRSAGLLLIQPGPS